MCRWIGYVGTPVRMEELILQTEHSLIDQSLRAREGAETTNGDGFGVGWYGDEPAPGVYKSTDPAWNDANLAEIARHIRSHLFIAHVRATTGTPIQRTNCHPFCHGQWIFVHNGVLHGYERLRRELALAVDPSLFFGIQGTTDSELMFNLALTFGLESEPLPALERMVGFIEGVGARMNIEDPVQMTLGLSDGVRLYAVRYSTEGVSRSLYHSRRPGALRDVNPQLPQLCDTACAIVSEPLSAVSDQWVRVPESTAVVVDQNAVEIIPFAPRAP